MVTKTMTKAKVIAQQIKRANGIKLSIMKKMISHTVPGSNNRKAGLALVDVSNLQEIVSIDPVKRICRAESGVTFSRLVKETLNYNLIPMCVSELKDITIGGAVSGTSLESMSFKYGGFHDTCFEYEIVTGKGDIMQCSLESSPDLFEAVHSSFGTLGIITQLAFHLIPVKPYVRMEYIHHSTFESYINDIYDHYQKQDIDFMDGIIHSPGDLILCIGNQVKYAPYIHTYSKEAFYKSTLRRKEDYIPIYDYLFRYDMDCHWIARNYGLENPILRTLFGPFFLGSHNLISWGSKLPFMLNRQRPDVVVDVFIPAGNALAFYKWYLSTYNYFPLWVVPYKCKDFYSWMNPRHISGLPDAFFIDFAIYGFRQPKNSINYYKILEQKVRELKGFKALITHNYYNEDDFWSIYNRNAYVNFKKHLDPHNIFDDIYKKLHRK
ncbi:MAG: FAD-binding oxidoreductase [Spirochaetales bacterium]|nr:FAD-binding oxidoreductase [Spirochaetales bacterium]